MVSLSSVFYEGQYKVATLDLSTKRTGKSFYDSQISLHTPPFLAGSCPLGYAPPMANRSPKAGCTLGIAILIVFSLVVTWTIYTGYTQNREIDKFTQNTRGDLNVIYRDADTVFALRARVREFDDNVRNDRPATLELTPADLNDLVGHEDRLIDMRELVSFQQIDGTTLKGRIAFPMQQLPFFGAELRYLNAEVEFRPELIEGQPMLRIIGIKPDNGTVIPEGFLNSISDNMNLLGPFRDDKQIKPIVKRLKSIGVANGRVAIQTN